MAEINKKDYLTGWVKTAIALNLIFIAITAAIFISKGYFNPTSEIAYNQLESFGSFVGGICSSITSLVAIYLVLKTYNSQKEELEETRKIAREQSETLKIQQFESTYFNMLKMLQEIVNSLYWDGNSEGIHEKREYINYFNTEIPRKSGTLTMLIEAHENISLEERARQVKDNISKAFTDIYNYHSLYLSHYLRYIYSIILYVENSLKEVDKIEYYLSFLQSQLSNDELEFLMLYSISYSNSKDKDKLELIKKINNYSFLASIGERSIIFKKEFLRFYFPSVIFNILEKEETTNI